MTAIQITPDMLQAAFDATEASELSEAVTRANQVESALNGVFFERDREIRCLMVALVAGEHVLLLGPPGTAKSGLTNVFCKALGGSMFQRLLTKYTTPEEVFGPVSLRALKDDRYERVTTGFLPTARVAFLDEIFKANSAILNSLLTALNERAFDNGTNRIQIPLEICVGASNELPESESLDALYDRFTLRRWVEPIKSKASQSALMMMTGAPDIQESFQEDDIQMLRAARPAVDISIAVPKLLEIFEALEKEHGIQVSDRRKRKCVKLVQAHALLQGRQRVEKPDLSILVDSLWKEPGERAMIQQTFETTIGPDDAAKAAQLVAAASEAASKVNMSAVGGQFTRAASDAVARTNQILQEMGTLDDPEIRKKAEARVAELIQPIRAEMAKRLGL